MYIQRASLDRIQSEGRSTGLLVEKFLLKTFTSLDDVVLNSIQFVLFPPEQIARIGPRCSLLAFPISSSCEPLLLAFVLCLPLSLLAALLSPAKS